jgi:SAM-dependent methyltransferase
LALPDDPARRAVPAAHPRLHLDVGPGTGYFLEHAGLPDGSRVTILDPNKDVLRHVSRRLRSLDVTAVEADVLKPLPIVAGLLFLPFAAIVSNMAIEGQPFPMGGVLEVLGLAGVCLGVAGIGALAITGDRSTAAATLPGGSASSRL